MAWGIWWECSLSQETEASALILTFYKEMVFPEEQLGSLTSFSQLELQMRSWSGVILEPLSGKEETWSLSQLHPKTNKIRDHFTQWRCYPSDVILGFYVSSQCQPQRCSWPPTGKRYWRGRSGGEKNSQMFPICGPWWTERRMVQGNISEPQG